MPVSDTPTPRRIIKCPGCGGPSVYGPDNPYRPFCGQRCKEGDLGAWASERFAVPVQPEADEELPDTSAPNASH